MTVVICPYGTPIDCVACEYRDNCLARTPIGITEARSKLILALYQKGKKASEIAEEVGVTQRTVYRILRKLRKGM